MKAKVDRTKHIIHTAGRMLIRPIVLLPLIGLVVLFVMLWIMANSAAQRYEASLTDYRDKVQSTAINTDAGKSNNTDKNNTDVKALADAVTKAPTLDGVFLGEMVSGPYREAKSKQSATEVYKSLVDLSTERNELDKKRKNLAKNDRWFRDEYIIRINKGIADTRGKKLAEIDVPAGLQKNATMQADYYKSIAAIFDSVVADLKKIDVPQPQQEPAAYLRMVMKNYADMYRDYEARSNAAKNFGDLTMARFMFTDDNDQAVSDIQDATAALGNTITSRSLENAALKATIDQDLPNITTNSSSRASLAAKLGYYQRYAEQSLKFDERGDEEYIAGGMKYALFQIENEINASDLSEVRKKQLFMSHQRSLDAIKWASNSARVMTNASFNLRFAIEDSMTYSGYSLQTKHLYDGQTYPGNSVAIEKSYKEIESWLENQYPYSKSMNALTSETTKKYIDALNLAYSFYREAEPVNKKIRAVVSEAYELSKKQSPSDADRQRIVALTTQTNQLKDQYKKLGDDFAKKAAASDAPAIARKAVQDLRTKVAQNGEKGTFKDELSAQFATYFDAVKR